MTLHLAALKDAITEPLAERPALVRVAAAVRTTGYHFVTITPSNHAVVNARPRKFEARPKKLKAAWKYTPPAFERLIAAAGWAGVMSWKSRDFGHALHLLCSQYENNALR